MNMFDEARALAITMKMRKLSQTEMAKSLGVSQSYVANKLRLLSIDEQMKKQITENSLTERHARALIRLKSNEMRQIVLDKVCKEKLSVKRTEALVDLYFSSEAPERIGRAERAKRIDLFIDNIKNSLNALSSTGVTSSHKISYENSRIYISICIKIDNM